MYQVRNLGLNPLTRTTRVLRPGRRTGFLLADGTRIRKKDVRATELGEDVILRNMDSLCEGVSLGYIEVKDPSGAVMSADALRGIGKPAAAPPPPPPPAPAPEATQEAPPMDAEELKKLSMAKLKKMASEAGLNPSDYASKNALVTALTGGK